MARLELRLSEDEKRLLEQEAAERGSTVSALARERLFGVGAGDDTTGRLEDFERRLSRLEEMANLG